MFTVSFVNNLFFSVGCESTTDSKTMGLFNTASPFYWNDFKEALFAILEKVRNYLLREIVYDT